jgi:hypothetical protein
LSVSRYGVLGDKQMIVLELKIIEGKNMTTIKSNGNSMKKAFQKLWNLVYEKGLIRNVW